MGAYENISVIYIKIRLHMNYIVLNIKKLKSYRKKRILNKITNMIKLVLLKFLGDMMTKKLVISKTKLFIFIIAFISIFIYLFGSKNTLIGVGIVTAMLTLLERDLTISPIKNLLKYLAINIILGILSFCSTKYVFRSFIKFYSIIYNRVCI